MKSVFIKVIRDSYYKDRTIGKVFVDGEFLGYSLEDAYRGNSVKIKKHTAIASGVYEVKIKRSPSKGVDRMYIENVPNFVGIQIHSGNYIKDTDGCILMGLSRTYDGDNSIITDSRKAVDKLFEIVKNAKNSYIEVINLNQIQ